MKPDKIWVNTDDVSSLTKIKTWYILTRIFNHINPPKDTATEYTRTALLSDDAWLAANGLMRVPEKIDSVIRSKDMWHNFGFSQKTSPTDIMCSLHNKGYKIEKVGWGQYRISPPTNSKEAASE